MINIFVFGSNLAGRHGKGAALIARLEHGAIYGIARGLTGNSYAIPTKNRYLYTLPIEHIQASVNEFIQFANQHPEMQFNLSRIGCGLAGYTDSEIAPLFKDVPINVIKPQGW